jgi:deoxyribodipyrimidine photolyase-related protein
MNCVAHAADAAAKHAYGHHIPGNFALLAGLAPAEVAEW